MVSTANLTIVLEECFDVKLFVNRENTLVLRMHPCGMPVFRMRVFRGLLVMKSIIHEQSGQACRVC